MPAHRPSTFALAALAATLIAAACSSGAATWPVATPVIDPTSFPSIAANPEPSVVVIEPPPVARPTGPLTRGDVLSVIGDTAITVEQLEP